MRDSASHGADPARRLRVFLCYCKEDELQVSDLYQRLIDDGFLPWLDKTDILPGQLWENEIPKAVRGSDAVIICLSPNSTTKVGYIQKEIHIAQEVSKEQPEGKIFIIPVRFSPCEIPQRLQDRQCADLFKEDGYSYLTKSLRLCASRLELPARTLKSASAAARDSKGEESYVKTVPRPPENIAARPRPLPKPARPPVAAPRSNKKSRPRILALSGAAGLIAIIAIVVGVSVSNGSGNRAISPPAGNSAAAPAATQETVQSAFAQHPDPQPEKTSEQPSANPALAEPQDESAEPQDEVAQTENMNLRLPISLGGVAPLTFDEFSILSRYRIDVFRVDDSRQQIDFAKEIRSYLERYAGEVKSGRGARPDLSRDSTKCEILYLHTSRDEEKVANILERQLNNVYPNASFKPRAVRKPTPNIVSLIIGSDCKK